MTEPTPPIPKTIAFAIIAFPLLSANYNQTLRFGPLTLEHPLHPRKEPRRNYRYNLSEAKPFCTSMRGRIPRFLFLERGRAQALFRASTGSFSPDWRRKD